MAPYSTVYLFIFEPSRTKIKLWWILQCKCT